MRNSFYIKLLTFEWILQRIAAKCEQVPLTVAISAPNGPSVEEFLPHCRPATLDSPRPRRAITAALLPLVRNRLILQWNYQSGAAPLKSGTRFALTLGKYARARRAICIRREARGDDEMA